MLSPKALRLRPLFTLIALGLFLALGFQNCGQFQTSQPGATPVFYDGLAIFDPDAGVTYNEPIAPKGQFASGYAHACAVISGDAVCWGANDYGQIGDGTKTSTGVPKKILKGGVTFVTTTNENGHRTCAIQNGALFCWGNNQGKLIDAALTADVVSPKMLLQSGVTAVSTSANQICAVVNGAALCKLGADDFKTILTEGVTAIAASQGGACAIANGSAWCWGENTYGQAGIGEVSATAQPTKVLDRVQLLVKNWGQTCAIADYSLFCWGRDNYNVQDKPILRPTELIHGGVSGLDIDAQGICYVKNSTVRCGRDLRKLGESIGTRIVGLKDFDGDGTSACARAPSELRCWGDNTYGQLGRGAFNVDKSETVYSTSAAQFAVGRFQTCYITNGVLSCVGLRTAYEPMVLGTNVAKMKFDLWSDGCFIQGGALKCFGSNTYGAIATGDVEYVDAAKPVTVFPSGVVDVDFDLRMNCTAKTDGVWCSGENYGNPFGIPGGGSQKKPIRLLTAPAKIIKIAHNSGRGACAVMQDTSLFCLDNTSGVGASNSSAGFRQVIASGVADVFIGTELCAVMLDGSLRCSTSSGLKQIDPGPVKDVTTVNYSDTCYILTNGILKCMSGFNGLTQVAEGAQAFGSENQVIINNELIAFNGIRNNALYLPIVLMTDVVSAARGTDHTCAIKKNGSLACLGGNAYGQSDWRTRAAEQVPQPILPAVD